MDHPNQNTVVSDLHTSDRPSSNGQRVFIVALVAIPCLMIAFGLLADPLFGPGAANITAVYLIIPVVLLYVLSASLLRGNPRFRRASRWTLQSYATSVLGLSEREKLVIDQAFRQSYRIIALICSLTFLCIFLNIYFLHLPYHLGQAGILYLIMGVPGLLSNLPAAIVAWREDR